MRRFINSLSFAAILWAVVLVLAMDIPINVFGEPEVGLGFWGWYWLLINFVLTLDLSAKLAVIYLEWRSTWKARQAVRREKLFQKRYPTIAASERGEPVDQAMLDIELYRMLRNGRR